MRFLYIMCFSSRELSHSNVCVFIGCVTTNNLITGVMYEYCLRGSLQDLILDTTFRMDKVFRVFFANDVVSGLEYLHSKKIVRGCLKSTSCVIDKHWRVKISGDSPALPVNQAQSLSSLYTRHCHLAILLGEMQFSYWLSDYGPQEFYARAQSSYVHYKTYVRCTHHTGIHHEVGPR